MNDKAAGAMPDIPASPAVDPDLDLPSEIAEFLETNPRAVFTCKVYRVDTSSKKGAHELIDEYENSIPAIREIGCENGAGVYDYYIRINAQGKKPRELRTFRINLAARWDRVRDQYLRSLAGAPAPGAAPASASVHDQLSLMKEMIACFAPLMAAQSSANPMSIMTSLAEMQSKMLASNFASNMDMQNKMMQTIEGARLNMLDQVSGGEGGDPQDQIISEIIGTLKQFVPALLMAPRAAQNALTDKALSARPDIRSVIADKAKRIRLIDRINSTFPQKQAKKIIEVVLGRVNGNSAAHPSPAVASVAARSRK